MSPIVCQDPQPSATCHHAGIACYQHGLTPVSIRPPVLKSNPSSFSDVFSYALAKVRGLPLLFKGDDFAQTDIVSAHAPER